MNLEFLFSVLILYTKAMPKDFTPLERAIEYFSSRVFQEVSLDGAATQAGITPQALGRLFKKYLGETPLHWIRRRRLSLAAWDLVNTELPVLEIALDYGYASSAAFNHGFRRYYGISPREFRARGKVPALLESPLEIPAILRGAEGVIEPELVEFEGLLLQGKSMEVTLQSKPEDDPAIMAMGGLEFYGVFPDRRDPLGLCSTDSYSFFAGIEALEVAPAGGEAFYLPGGTYACFSLPADPSMVGELYRFIYSVWLRRGSYKLRFAPDFFKVAQDGSAMEVYIPLR